MVVSLLYTSTPTFPTGEHEPVVEALVAQSRTRNAALNVSGALISTERHFAQVLEGSPEAVDELMASIQRDPRHADVRIAQHIVVDQRFFANWAMAYSGPSTYVAQHVQPLIASARGDAESIDAADRLISVMQEYVSGS